MRKLLCQLSALDPERGVREYPELGEKGIFLIRLGHQLFAYANSCPHTGIELNWQPGQFLDYEGYNIQCAVHGALFRIENGYCFRGPCQGQYLQKVPVFVINDEVWLGDARLP